MFFVLFAMWLIFNGRITGEIVIIGLVLSLLIYLFMLKFMGLNIKTEWRSIQKVPRVVRYIIVLVVEIIKANFQVLRFIYSPKLEVEPELTTFQPKVRSDLGKAVLANTITLTPGTITIHVKDNTFMVHCLDSSLKEGLADSSFEKQIVKMEEA